MYETRRKQLSFMRKLCNSLGTKRAHPSTQGLTFSRFLILASIALHISHSTTRLWHVNVGRKRERSWSAREETRKTSINRGNEPLKPSQRLRRQHFQRARENRRLVLVFPIDKIMFLAPSNSKQEVFNYFYQYFSLYIHKHIISSIVIVNCRQPFMNSRVSSMKLSNTHTKLFRCKLFHGWWCKLIIAALSDWIE